MNILYVSYFGLGIGGAEQSLKHLIDEISKKHNVYVATTGNFQFKNTIKFKRYRYIPFFSLQEIYLKHFLKKIIKNKKIDIIHCNDRLTSIASIKASKEMKKPVICHFRDYWFFCPKSTGFNKKNCKNCSYLKILNCSKYHRYLWDFYKLNKLKKQRKILDQANIKIAISSKIKEKLEKFNIKNSIIIPNPIKIKKSHKRQHEKNEKINLLYIGRLDYNKGLQNIIKLIDFKKMNLIVAGKGPLENKIKKYPIKYLGWVNNTSKLYQEADIVIIPSLWEEPFGRIAIEAMNGGCPVISSNIGGLKDIIKNNQTGFLVHPLNFKEWEEKINLLGNDRKLREKFSQNALKEVKKYDIKQISKKIENLYLKSIK